jgi:hypothetical protein
METAKLPLTDEWIKCVIYTEWNFTQPQTIMNFCHSQKKWMELENIILNEVSQAQNAKRHMFSLIINLIQVQQYYGTWVTLTRVHTLEGSDKEKKPKI